MDVYTNWTAPGFWSFPKVGGLAPGIPRSDTHQCYNVTAQLSSGRVCACVCGGGVRKTQNLFFGTDTAGLSVVVTLHAFSLGLCSDA